ncbi:hypothetical protein ACRALDRAFT_2040125 [Sodiomyces alcalophilus JCM 7366]|uniref:uncharacterized protein n=1 Tax=Sodiomyces alcalophilus JCM 7366 TaxID=591952 RepID=UPI0039B4891D
MPVGSRRRRVQDDDTDGEDQRPRQRRNRDGSFHDGDRDDTAQDEGDTMDMEATPDEQLAKKLVRYALSCDFARTPIRRDGIKERVLGDQGRAFRRVLEIAQTYLRQVFGMELRELPVREKHSLEEKRKAVRSQSQPKTSTGVYILVSTLPPAYRSAAIIPPSRIPSADAEAAYVAFYTMVITVIMLNGGELSDAKLRRYLHRLNAEDNVGAEPTEDVLKRMLSHGYITKHVQRDETSQAHDSGENTTWYVGPRGQEEVGVEGATGMIRAVWGPQDERGGEELEKKISASFGRAVAREADGEADGAGGEEPS